MSPTLRSTTPTLRPISMEEAAGSWSRLLSESAVSAPFQTVQWQRLWLREMGDSQTPRILSLEDDGGRVVGLAPLRESGGDGRLTFIGDQDLYDYNDFLIEKGHEAAFFEALLNCMEAEGWAALELYSLAEHSPTVAQLPEAARARGLGVEVVQQEVCPGAELNGDWEGYLSGLSKKRRHELRRKLRRLHTAEGLKWYALSDPAEVAPAMDSFFELLKMSRDDKREFLTPARERFFRAAAEEMSALGLFKLHVMEIEGRRVSAAITLEYEGRRLLYNSGYDPAYGRYAVGLLLKALSLKSAIEEGLAYYDFLRGDEPYKYHLGGVDKSIYNMVITKS